MWTVIFTLFLLLLLIFGTLFIRYKIQRNSKGRYILITGCDTSEFGNALAKSLDQKGCYVFAACSTSEGAESLKGETSGRLHAMTMDVSKNRSIKAAFDEVNEQLAAKSGELSRCLKCWDKSKINV